MPYNLWECCNARVRCLRMGQEVNSEELRELLRLAKMLRRSAPEARRPYEADLFLHTAMALEERASQLAFGGPPALAPALYNPVDLFC